MPGAPNHPTSADDRVPVVVFVCRWNHGVRRRPSREHPCPHHIQQCRSEHTRRPTASHVPHRTHQAGRLAQGAALPATGAPRREPGGHRGRTARGSAQEPRRGRRPGDRGYAPRSRHVPGTPRRMADAPAGRRSRLLPERHSGTDPARPPGRRPGHLGLELSGQPPPGAGRGRAGGRQRRRRQTGRIRGRHLRAADPAAGALPRQRRGSRRPRWRRGDDASAGPAVRPHLLHRQRHRRPRRDERRSRPSDPRSPSNSAANHPYSSTATQTCGSSPSAWRGPSSSTPDRPASPPTTYWQTVTPPSPWRPS